MKRKLAIIGGGELGKQILNISLSCEEFEVIGFFDDWIKNGSLIIDTFKVIGDVSNIVSYYESGRLDCIILGIGYHHMESRKTIFEKLSKKIPFATIIHKSCIIDSSAKVGQGTVIYPGCIIDKNVIIGENNLLNLGVVVSHDTQIDSHCFIAPRAVFSGFVTVNKSCFIGTGTIFKDNITIESNIILGAGTLVSKNLTDSGTYVGSPARRLK